MATYTFERYQRPLAAWASAQTPDKAVIEAQDDATAIRLARERAARLRPQRDFAVLLDENASEIWVWRDFLS